MEEWTFGTYQVKSLIGRGGMGEVYRAYDTEHDRMVALKLLATHLSADESYRARFRRECHLAARLREPHVIPIHSYGEIDGRLFLDMRLVEGRDLGDVLATSGALPMRRAVDIVGQVARALDAAHDDGLIHRDVKPSNVIIAEEGDADSEFVFVYLVDFGVARAVGDDGNSNALTQTGGAVGTFDYMPPERFEGVPADRHTDVYSLTCMLFETLTGRRPYPGADLPTLMYAHMNSVPPAASKLNPSLTEAMDAVIARGMAKDPNARFDTAGALASAARAALRAAEQRDGGADAPELTESKRTALFPQQYQDRPSDPRTAWPDPAGSASPTVGPAPFYHPAASSGSGQPVAPPAAGSYPTPYPAAGPGTPSGAAPAAWSPPNPVNPPAGPSYPPGPSYPSTGTGSAANPGSWAPAAGAAAGWTATPVPTANPNPTSSPSGFGTPPPPPAPGGPVSQPGAYGAAPPSYGGPAPHSYAANPPSQPGGPPPGGWAGGPSGPAAGGKKSRLPLIIAAVVAVAVVATIAIVLITRSGGSSNQGASTGPTTSEGGPSFRSQSSSASAPVLDSQLLSLLPDTIDPKSCTSSTVSDTKAVVGIKCGASTDSANGPTVSWFYRYPDVASLQADFGNVVANNKLAQATAQCPGIGYRNWNFQGTPDQVAGQLASYTDTSGTPTITWTDEKNLELVVAQNFAPNSLPGLCTWWKSA